MRCLNRFSSVQVSRPGVKIHRKFHWSFWKRRQSWCLDKKKYTICSVLHNFWFSFCWVTSIEGGEGAGGTFSPPVSGEIKHVGKWAASDTNRRRTIANKLRIWAPSRHPFPSCLNYICVSGQAEGRLCIRLLQNVLKGKNKSPSFDIWEHKHAFVTRSYHFN